MIIKVFKEKMIDNYSYELMITDVFKKKMAMN